MKQGELRHGQKELRKRYREGWEKGLECKRVNIAPCKEWEINSPYYREKRISNLFSVSVCFCYLRLSSIVSWFFFPSDGFRLFFTSVYLPCPWVSILLSSTFHSPELFLSSFLSPLLCSPVILSQFLNYAEAKQLAESSSVRGEFSRARVKLLALTSRELSVCNFFFIFFRIFFAKSWEGTGGFAQDFRRIVIVYVMNLWEKKHLSQS